MLPLVLPAWRSWKSAKSVAMLSIAALALGIGSAVAIYSVVQAVLLQPLPYRNAERYFVVRGEWRANPGFWTIFSYPDYLDILRQQPKSLEAFGCTNTGNFNIRYGTHALRAQGSHANAAFMRSLGIPAVLGDWFPISSPPEENPYAVVLSASLWKDLGADPQITGRSLIMNGKSYSVAGVMPAWFHYPPEIETVQLWTPFDPADYTPDRKAHYLECFAKTAAGFSVDQARHDLDRIQATLQRDHPNQAEPDITTATPLLPELVRDVRPRLLLLLAGSLALLLITCANVASLLLARSVGRARDTAVRVSLGASMWQLGVQYFMEGFLLSFAGALAGSLLSYGLVRSVLQIAADQIPRADQVHFNWFVLGFAVLVAVACGLLVSLAPLWQAYRIPPAAVLTEGVRATANAGSRRVLQILVVGEIALAFGLLATGGLLLQQLNFLYHVNPGFDPNQLLTFHVFAPQTKYTTLELQTRHRDELERAIAQVPGVESAGFTSTLPLNDEGANTWFRRDDGPKRPWVEESVAYVIKMNPEYLTAMRIPIVAGRSFTQTETDHTFTPVLVNQDFVRQFFGKRDPLGALIREFDRPDTPLQIIGVVGDVHAATLSRPPHPEVLFSFRMQNTQHMMWAVRSATDPSVLLPRIQAAIFRVDPEEAIFRVRTMHQIIDESVSGERLQSLMLSFFATAALLLSTLGVYGIVGYSVRQRTVEIGTRMAVGATTREILSLVLRNGFRLSLFGAGLGLLIVMASTHFLKTSDLHIQIQSIAPFVGALLMTIVLTSFATWYPAWRAASLSPLAAIREESSPLRVSYQTLLSKLPAALNPSLAESRDPIFLPDIVGASRLAESFPDALHVALTTIYDKVAARDVFLFAHRAEGQPYRLVASALGGPGASNAIPPDGLLLGRIRFVSSALVFTAEDLATLHAWACEHAPQHCAEVQVLQELETRLAVPILSKAEILGMLLFAQSPDDPPFTVRERRALAGAAQQLGLILENGRLMDRIVDQERLRRELLMATEVQKRLFPEHPLATDHVQLVGTCMPARGVGGDYYDFLDLGNQQIGIALADVAGKGIAAALIMSIVQASLRSLAGNDGASLGDLASKMNRLLHRSTGASSYATFFYAQLDQSRNKLRYVNAGHNPPYLLRGSDIIELPASGMIIGMFANASYEEVAIDIQPGDLLMLFSDGVPEAHDPQEEEFGEDRIQDLLRRYAPLPLEDMANSVLQELKAWMADAPQYDDLTFVLMKLS